MSPEAYGDTIYNFFLFDVPRLLDICAVYGGSNRRLTTKMVENIFSKQTKYCKDLSQTVSKIKKVGFLSVYYGMHNNLLVCGNGDPVSRNS